MTPLTKMIPHVRVALASLGTATMLLSIVPPASAQSLLAGWSFNNQSSQGAVLTADMGTLAGAASFSTGIYGSGNTFTMNGDGTVTLGQGYYLSATAINSSSFSSLTSNVTIWASVTVLGSPFTNHNGALFGLTNAAPPMTGSPFVTGGTFGYAVNNSSPGSTTDPTVRATGTLSDGTTTIGPASGLSTIHVGTETSVAVVFNRTGATSFTYFDYTNGAVVTRSATGANSTLNAFTALSIGRLNQGGADYSTGLQINEIRIYEGSLTSEQLSAIVPVPEPSSTALLITTALGFLLWNRRRSFGRK